MKRKLFSMLPGFVFSMMAAKAQYKGGESALGIRGGTAAAGVSYKYFQSKTFSYEGLVNYVFDDKIKSMAATVLFEKQAPLIGNKFSAQVGLGPSYLFSPGRFGAAGTLGFDWRISVIDLSVDWQPGYYFSGDNHFTATNVGVGVRYILNHGRKDKYQRREDELKEKERKYEERIRRDREKALEKANDES